MLNCKGGSRAYKDFSSYARPQHCQPGVKGEPGSSPRNLQRKKESARRGNLKPGQNQKKKLDEKDTAKERYHLEPKPLTHRTSTEEVLQQTNALVLIVNHARSRFGVNPCGGAIAKSHGICNGKYAEEVSPKLKLQGYFYRERTSSASF